RDARCALNLRQAPGGLSRVTEVTPLSETPVRKGTIHDTEAQNTIRHPRKFPERFRTRMVAQARSTFPRRPVSRRRPTLAEVARQAGVSVSTVSKVVNGHLDVAAETRRQVEQLLEQHQYRPRRSPSRRRVGLIDLVFQDLDNSWAMQILHGVEQAAHEQGVGVVVSAVRDEP